MAAHTTLSGLAARVASTETTIQDMKARIATLEAAIAGQRLNIPHRGDTGPASPVVAFSTFFADAIDGDVGWVTEDGRLTQ